MNVLIVDDNANNCYLLRLLLEGQGHRVTTAANGHEALAALGGQAFDLIVSDILMPGMDGFQFCREIKGHPVYRRIPFIFYTATYTDPKDEALALSLGADAFLVKPMERADFIEAIGRVIDRILTEPRPAPQSVEPETIYLQQYNQRLIQKLEAKMEQLERADAELRREVLERRQSEMTLHLAQRVGHIGSWQLDPAGRTLVWSAEALKILGLAPAPARLDLDRFLERIDEEDRELVRTALNTLGPGSDGLAVECRYQHPGGTLRHLALRAEAFAIDPAEAERRVGIVRDLTEQRQAEEARAALELQLQHSQKMEAIGTLAGGIAHDFNNMLGVIAGHANLIRRDLPPDANPDILASLDAVVTATHRSQELTHQILTFSRRKRVERRPCPLAPLVREAMRLLRATIPNSIAIEFELDEASAAALIDPGEIHQILINLCTNAVHAMGRGGGRLEVGLVPVTLDRSTAQPLQLEPGRYARLAVRDTGAGMDAATLARIFEPFFTTKAPGQGTGLGLATVHGIVRSCGGAITAESHPGRGTLFQVYLPRLDDSATAEDLNRLLPPLGQGQHILLVDNEPLLVQITKSMLLRLNYKVSSFTVPDQALREFIQSPTGFDLAITDYVMPTVNGADLAREFKKICPGLPVILISGLDLDLNEAQLADMGLCRVLAKPFDCYTLGVELQHLLHPVPNT